ncbi:MAG TPA: polyphosphate kinase 2 family protein [Bryobacteraceae bacterium]|nr:polyphosphate kinase 2 family protein [Bryobacteraceae bacterium]
MPREFSETKLVKRLIVPPGRKIKLSRDFATSWKEGRAFDKHHAAERLREGIRLLSGLQSKLYAQNRYALLINLQAMDAAGKDGTIKHVMSGINPQGCRVTSFKAPSSEELDHDYLWRHVKVLPERGHIGIFNRSYYEEVLVVRLHPEYLEKQQLPPSVKGRKIWRRRFEQINNFEKYLRENGIVVLKIFLYVSKEEQRQRFLKRIDRSEKNWKLSAADVNNRLLWDKYMDAYEDCFNNTSTAWAPWYVVPADQKPYCRLLVAFLIYHSLAAMNLAYPIVSKERRAELINIRRLLERG